MPEVMELNFLLQNPQALVRLLEQAAVNAERLAAGVERVNKATAAGVRGMKNVTPGAGAPGGAGGSGGSGGAGGAYGITAGYGVGPTYPIPPNMRPRAPINIPQAGANNSVMARLSRATIAAGGGGFTFKGMADAGLSSIGALGPEGKAAELAARALVALAATVYTLAEASAAASESFTKMRQSVGGTGADAALGIGIGKAGGFDYAAAAAAVHEKITHDPIAMGQAAQAGVYARPGPYGTQNWGAELDKQLERIANMPKDQQIRALRIAGVPEAANYVSESASVRKQIRDDRELTKNIQNPVQVQAAADYEGQKARFDQARENFATALGRGPMQTFTEFFQKSADTLNAITDFAMKHKDMLKGIEGAVQFALGLDMKGSAARVVAASKDYLSGGANAGSAPGGTVADMHTAMNNNTDALVRHMETSERLIDATNKLVRAYGGGERSQEALPTSGDLRRTMLTGGLMRQAI